MRGHSICFHSEMSKVISELSLLFLLILNSGQLEQCVQVINFNVLVGQSNRIINYVIFPKLDSRMPVSTFKQYRVFE